MDVLDDKGRIEAEKEDGHGPVLCYEDLEGASGSGLYGVAGLGGGGVCGVAGLVDVVCDAFEAVPEAAVAFAEALAELRELLASEEDDNDDRENDQMPWLKQVAHTLFSKCGRRLGHTAASTIVAQRGPGGLEELKIRADMGRTLYLGYRQKKSLPGRPR